MSVETHLEETYKQFMKDEKELQGFQLDKYEDKIKTVLSIAFIVHLVFLAWGYFFIGNIIPEEPKVAWYGFMGIGLAIWFVIGTGYWFSFKCGEVSAWFRKKHATTLKIRSLKSTQKKRDEFFKFYELFKSDDTFKEKYLSMVSNSGANGIW